VDAETSDLTAKYVNATSGMEQLVATVLATNQRLADLQEVGCSGAVVWCCGAVVLWCCGDVVWCSSAVVQWCNGAMVQWCCVILLW
jgi:hypothetical protein